MALKASSAMTGMEGGAAGRVMIGLGSNRCHGRHGPPERVLLAAAQSLADGGVRILALSPVVRSAPLGPSRRQFANAAILGLWPASPHALLDLLKAAERAFGRRPGQRWGARVLDCDLLAFERQVIRTGRLTVPHPGLPHRSFVLGPLIRLWPTWRHPVSGLTVRQMAARLAKPRPVRLSGRSTSGLVAQSVEQRTFNL
ncbi:2-amino-4-hydroxy-6-hydroxymethyldihydropteridine diphosphokinase [Thermaurantiacus sp.]